MEEALCLMLLVLLVLLVLVVGGLLVLVLGLVVEPPPTTTTPPPTTPPPMRRGQVLLLLLLLAIVGLGVEEGVLGLLWPTVSPPIRLYTVLQHLLPAVRVLDGAPSARGLHPILHFYARGLLHAPATAVPGGGRGGGGGGGGGA